MGRRVRLHEKDGALIVRLIIFFRDNMFYPIEYPASHKDWQAEADRNPGTTRIEDGITGEVLWLPQEAA